MDGVAGLGHQWASLITSVAAHRSDEERVGRGSAHPDPPTAIPVTLLTGFLGAGKSTILAELLSDPGDAGVVRAVVNDVGRLPFDPTLIASEDAGAVELTNGCGCCVAGAAAELAERLDQVAVGADLVVLEASGLADPAALAQVVEARPGLALDRIVAVVDARAVDRLLELDAVAPLLRRQLAVAEAVILSHVDAGSPEDTTSMIESIAVLAPGTPIVTSDLTDPAHRVLRPGFRVGAAVPTGTGSTGTAAPEPVTRSFSASTPVPADDLHALIDRHRGGLLRVKGRVLLDGRPTLVQLTPSGLTCTPAGPGPLGLTAVATDATPWPDLAELLGQG